MAPAGAARVDGMGWDGMLTVVHFAYAEAPKRCLVPQSRVATVLALTPARQCAERAVGALLAAQDVLCAGHPWALPCAWARLRHLRRWGCVRKFPALLPVVLGFLSAGLGLF